MGFLNSRRYNRGIPLLYPVEPGYLLLFLVDSGGNALL
jgi:hypothetical protein